MKFSFFHCRPVASVNKESHSFKLCRLPIQNVLMEPAGVIKYDPTKIVVVNSPRGQKVEEVSGGLRVQHQLEPVSNGVLTGTADAEDSIQELTMRTEVFLTAHFVNRAPDIVKFWL